MPQNTLIYELNGMEQIGCIYTTQGFEFDYVGMIIGNDLSYNPDPDTERFFRSRMG